jgi:DNA-binding IclR family transcriptional regulator
VLAEGFFESHICTVAAPVRDQEGRIAAAIGITIPGSDIPAEKHDEFVAAVRTSAERLSSLLNFRPEPSTHAVVVPIRRART